MKIHTSAMTLLSASVVAVVVAGLSCRESDAASRKESPAASQGGQAGTVGAHIEGNNFKIDTESGECKVGQECAAKVKLTATGGYHINKEYPYKLTMQADKSVDFLGKNESDKKVFSKPLGDFTGEEKEATMNVRFKPTAAGDVVLKGTYKMSVCSEQNCQLETKELTLEVKIKK